MSIRIRRKYFQIRKKLKTDSFLKREEDYLILDPNHLIYGYNYKSKEDVIKIMKLYKKKYPNDEIWYTIIDEEDIYLDDLENGTIFI